MYDFVPSQREEILLDIFIIIHEENFFNFKGVIKKKQSTLTS